LRYSCVLFDLDGTLIDSETDLVAAVQHGFGAAGAEPPERTAIVSHIGKPLRDFPRLIGRSFTEEQVRVFADAYRVFYAEHCMDHSFPYPGVRETLEQLKTAGIRLGVVTVKRQDQAEGTLKKADLARYFDHIRGWSEGQKLKPDPEPLLETIAALQARAEDTLMVGDSEQDIFAAQAAGIDVAACLYGFRDPEYLRSLKPTYEVMSFEELAPIILAENPRPMT
jgi:2-phosphoglycolate phosphatase